MIRDFALERPGTDWLNLLIESIKSWYLKWNARKLEKNYFLIN